jgi:WD40 repeat protein
VKQKGNRNKSSAEFVPPWKSAVLEPTEWIPCNQTTDVDLTLKWIHGHRSRDCRNNVLYSAEGSIVYMAANIGVVYHKPSGRQQFLNGPHVDEIISIAIHPAGQIFATGEAGRKASIIVWHSKSMQVLSRLESIHQTGVGLMCFNSSGDTLASIGLDGGNTLCIHNWHKNIQVLRTSTARSKTLCMCFLARDQLQSTASTSVASSAVAAVAAVAVTTKSKKGGMLTNKRSRGTAVESMLPADKDILVTAGYKFLKFWWWQGQNVQSQTAIWRGAKDEHKTLILSIASGSHGICVTGSSTGNLLVWKNFKVKYSY